MSASTRSGKNSPDTTREDAPPDINSYAIEIPEGFVAAYPTADTVAEALRLAEQVDPAESGTEHEYQDLTNLGATTTAATGRDDSDAPRCVRCGSRRLSPKSTGTQDKKLTEGYVCETCRTHVSDPEHPETAEIVFSDGQTQLGRWSQ